MPCATEIPTVEVVRCQAEEFGLVLRGGFKPDADDCVQLEEETVTAGTLLLFGNAGSSIWPCFSQSPELQDQQPDPLNRWSERIGNQLAQRWGGVALFPFGGPPYQPFLRWAKKAESLESSKLGMLMHPVFGLWHAYRFAIAFEAQLDLASLRTTASPLACNTCVCTPCLNSCPVDAFNGSSYDVERCFGYLDNHPEADCHHSGCRARAACPEAVAYRYQPEHAAFHMEKFYQSLQIRFS